MEKFVPTIELENGERYEIHRSRYIIKEIERVQKNSSLTDEDSKNYAILQDKYERLRKLAERVKELEDEYYEEFDSEVGETLERAKVAYEKLFAETAEFEIATKGVANKANRETINKIEQIVITALTFGANGAEIRDRKSAEEIWCTFVDERGHEATQEWLIYAYNYLSGSDGGNDTDPFVKQARAKQEQKASMRRGISKAK